MTKEGNFTQKAIHFSFLLLIFFTPLLWISTTSELFEFPKILFLYFMTTVITSLWLIRSFFDRHFYFTRTWLTIPISIFLLSQFISTIFSIDTHTSLFGYYSRFHGGLLSYLAYALLFLASISNLHRKHLKSLVLTLLFTTILTTAYSFPEHYGHSPSCLLITGQFNAVCWVQDVQNRVFGTFGQPNWQAAYIVTTIFLPLALFLTTLKAKSPRLTRHNLPYLLLTILMFIVLLFTKSRSGLLGFGLGFAVFLFLHLLKPLNPSRKSSTYTLLLPILFTLTFLVFGRGIYTPLDSYISRITPLPTHSNPVTPPPAPSGTQLETGGTESGEIRKIVWQGALDLFMRYPLFGSGTETFAYSYFNVRPLDHNLVSEWDFLYNKAHNEFLNFLATTGLFGFLSYCFLLLSFCFWWFRHYLYSSDPDRYLSLAFLSGTIALSVSNFFGFSTVSVSLLLFLFPAFSLISRVDPPSTQAKPTSPHSWIFVTLTAIASLFLLHQIYTLYLADTHYAQGKSALQNSDVLTAITLTQKAAELFPSEPVYTEQLSLAAAHAASLTHQAGDATAAATIADQAILISNLNLAQNPVHLNFHKSRASLFITLSLIDPSYLTHAQNALLQASKLAPTDPKLIYNLAVITAEIGDTDLAEQYFHQSLELKPNYELARVELATFYEKQSRFPEAIAQYQYILDNLKPGDPATLKQLDRLATRSATVD